MNFEQYFSEVSRKAASKGIDLDKPGLMLEMSPEGLRKMLSQAHREGYRHGYKTARAVEVFKSLITKLLFSNGRPR